MNAVGPYPNSNYYFGIDCRDVFTRDEFWNVIKKFDIYLHLYGTGTADHKEELTNDSRVEVRWNEEKKVDWSRTVTRLEEDHPDWIKFRYTDHQYRNDSRNITYLKDFEIGFEKSVDNLYSQKELSDHIVHLATGVPLDRVHELYTS